MRFRDLVAKVAKQPLPVVGGGFAALALLWLAWPATPPGAGQGKLGPGAESRPVPVVTATVIRKDVPLYLDALGTVQAFNTVTVRPRVDGELVDVLFKEGQDVKAGDVLAQIDPRTYRAQYEQALATRDRDQAQLEAARRDLARYVSLGDRVSGQQVDSQRAQVRQLEATLRLDEAAISNARTMLGYTVITAPFDGRAGMRLVDKGNILRASDSTGLVTLTQIQPISVLFTLPQQALPAISEAMKAAGRLKVKALQPETRTLADEGELELVDNLIDQTTGTVRLKAVMPNAERRLWPGGFVNIRLLLSIRDGGLVIPAPAVQRGPQGSYVFVVRQDNTVEMRAVSLATTEAGEALLDKGLEEGETVVVDGVAKLAQGSRIVAGGGGGGGSKAP